MPEPAATSADPAELRRFALLAERWWDENGPLAPLHKLNPTRLGYIRQQACTRFGRDPGSRDPRGGDPARRDPEGGDLECDEPARRDSREGDPRGGDPGGRATDRDRHTRDPGDRRPLEGLAVLDVGCGGGLLCEPLARLGARVTGIDLEPANLAVAMRHAARSGLDIDYRRVAVEDLAADGARFDLVCVMEVVEHVADPDRFLDACGQLVAPGGGLVLATLNRTFRAFALGIVAAEYLLGWLPRGTHRWSRFVRPSEAARALRRPGLRVADLTGVAYDPLRDRFRLSADPAVNYMLFAVRD